MSNRIIRVNELIKEQLSLILEEGFNKKNCLVSIVKVKTSADLRQARVYISIFPSNKKKEIFSELKENLSIFQYELGNKLDLKYTPKIEIFIDESLEKDFRLDELFDKIKDDRINS